MGLFAIGKLSELTGVKIATIRYYEINGLLPAAARTDTNRRTYDDVTVLRLRFIRHARELGFEVDAIRILLDLADRPDRPRAETETLAHRCVADIDDRINRLSSLRGEMMGMIDRCGEGGVVRCHAIEVLAAHDGHPDASD